MAVVVVVPVRLKRRRLYADSGEGIDESEGTTDTTRYIGFLLCFCSCTRIKYGKDILANFHADHYAFGS
jgi:hypothetical protein